MTILLSSNDFRTRDIYIDYPFEDAKFRWDKDTQKVYRRFYGEEEDEIPHSSDLYNQALSAGVEITREEYFQDRAGFPPEGRDGPFELTISLGWCGGHGEAVLDGSGAIQRHRGLPVFVDPGSQEAILERIDLGGGIQGAPRIRISGQGRLKRRRGRNPSIPTAPKQRYVALIVTTLDEARLEV